MKSVFAVAVYGRYLGGYLLEDIKDYLYSIKRCENRHSVLNGAAAYLNSVLKMRAGENRTRVDNIADVARSYGVEDFRAALAELAANAGADTVLLEERRSSGGRLDVEAEMVEPLDKRQSLLLVLIGKGDYDCAVFLHLDSGRLERLVERSVEALVVAYRFAGGLHLGREIRVHTGQLLEREGGRFDIPAFAVGQAHIRYALLAQALTEHNLCRYADKVAVGGLRKERHACWQDDIPFLPSIGCNESHTVFAGMYVPLGLIGPVVFVLSLSPFQ